MGQLTQQVQLSQNALAVDLILEDASHLLNGNFLSCWLVDSAAHGAVAALAKKLHALVVATDLPVSESVDSQSLALAHLSSSDLSVS